MTPELPNILISAKDLYLKAGRNDLVEAVSLEVSEGEIVSVIGPNRRQNQPAETVAGALQTRSWKHS